MDPTKRRAWLGSPERPALEEVQIDDSMWVVMHCRVDFLDNSHREAGLFVTLPNGRCLHGFTGLNSTSRELCETCQRRARWTNADYKAVVGANDSDSDLFGHDCCGGRS